MKASKAVRDFLAAVGSRGGFAGTGASKVRGGATAAERRAYYKRISKKGVAARARNRRARECE